MRTIFVFLFASLTPRHFDMRNDTMCPTITRQPFCSHTLKRPIFSTLVWEQTFEKNWNRSAPNSPLSVHRRSDLCIPYIDVTPLICTASWLSDDIVHCRVAHRFVSPPWGVVGRHRMAFDPCFHFSPDITASVDTQLHKWLLWSCRAGVIIRISVLFCLGPLYKTDYFFGFFSLKIHKNMCASLVHDVTYRTAKCDVLGCFFLLICVCLLSDTNGWASAM